MRERWTAERVGVRWGATRYHRELQKDERPEKTVVVTAAKREWNRAGVARERLFVEEIT